MKREKPKGQQEVVISYQKGRMVFEVGDREFYLTEEAAGKLFGRSVGIEFERLSGKDEDFGGIKSLGNFIKIARLMRKGLPYFSIAKAMNYSEQQVKEFYNFEVRRPRVEGFNVQSIENERQRQAADEMDFCREAQRPRALNETADPTPGEKFVDLLRVKTLQRQGKKNGEIADYLSLDRTAFDRFLEKNRQYLDLIP